MANFTELSALDLYTKRKGRVSSPFFVLSYHLYYFNFV